MDQVFDLNDIADHGYVEGCNAWLGKDEIWHAMP
jgi:hypothetical protein